MRNAIITTTGAGVAHEGFGVYPEDHLWRAAQALREIEDALPE